METAGNFFVVGGPVQPDRPSYISRAADRELHERLRAREFCHVLAPHQMGKTSLMAQTAHRLRGDGIDVAMLDLAEIGGRNVADDIARWYYSFAYRVVRELRIRSEMTHWWQARSSLTIRQRLRDFFLEVVLEDRARPVVILLDRIESIADRRELWEIFDAVRGCYDARATEPEYQRLTFALLGTTGAARALKARPDSVFAISTDVALADFSAGELEPLGAGLPLPAREAACVTRRIWHWTAGQPYLSQKICRSLARRTPAPLDEGAVDKTVGRLFFGRNSLRGDPHLTYLGAQLARPSAGRAARLTLYGKVRKGARLAVNRSQLAQRELLDLGLLVDADGQLALRNRIYEGVFTALWVNRNLPFSWQGVAAAAAVLVVLIGAPLWYRDYLPQPYVRALTSDRQEFVVARDAWERLRRFPGFTARADALFLDYLVRQSRRATRLSEVQRIGERIEELPGGAERAGALLAEFWDRRTNAMTQRGDRDAAILFSLQSLVEPTAEREGRLAELLSGGLAGLIATARPGAPLTDLEIDPDNGLITTLDERHEIAVWRSDGERLTREQRLQLTAEDLRPLQRRLILDAPAPGRRVTVGVRLDHAEPSEVEIVLRAPTGRQAVLRVAEAQRGRLPGEFRFDSRRDRALAPVLGQGAAGTWSASFADTRRGVSGELLSWDLDVDGVGARDAGEAADPIPEPQPAMAAMSALGPAGRRALSWPGDESSRGDVLAWDVAAGRVLARLPRPGDLRSVRFVLGHSAVMLVGDRELEFRDTVSGRLLGRLPRTAGAPRQPLLSADGRYLVYDAQAAAGGSELIVLDLKTMSTIGRLVTGTSAQLVAVDPLGGMLAVGDDEQLVRIWRVRDQTLLAECEHAGRPLHAQFDAAGRWLATVDGTGRLRVWDVAAGCRQLVTRRGNGAWQVAFTPDGNGLAAGNLSRGIEFIRLPGGERVGPAIQPGMAGAGSIPSTRAARWQFLPRAAGLLTYDGRKALKLWSLPLGAGPSEAPAFAPGGAELAVSHDRAHLALGMPGGDVQIMPLGPAAELRLDGDAGPAFVGHTAEVTRLVFDPQSRLLASGAIDGTIRVWDAASGAPRTFFASLGDGAIQDLAFLPDGSALAAASRSSAALFDLGSGASRGRLLIRAEQPRLAVAPDGLSVLIAGDEDGLTRWDLRSGAATRLAGSEYRLHHVVFSANGQLIATAGADRVVRLWRPQTGAPLRRGFTVPAPVEDLWFTDGEQLTVQAGAWLHTLAADASGLAALRSRPLPDADSRVFAGAERNLLVVTRASTLRPQLLRISSSEPWVAPGAAKVDSADIRGRLQLTVNEHGEIRPVE